MAANAVKKAQPQWTDEQCRAIATRDVSVALSAGAGCGKTFVLTERFLAHLEPEKSAGAGHTRLGQLVAITFTERAAREMRERIREKCLKRLRDCPEDQADHWLCLLNELDSARISTIHSFCASLLRSHAVEAALDPRFRVLDQAQANTLLNESIDDFLRETLSTVGGESSDRTAISAEYARNEPCALFEAAVNLSARYGLRGVREMIAKLLNCRQEINWPSWRAVTVDNLLAKWRDYFNREALPQILRKICCSSAAKKVLEIARKKPCHHPIMRQRMTFLCEHLPRLTECDAPKKILSEIRDATIVKGAGTKKDWPNADLYEQYKIAVTKLRQIIDKQTVLTCFDPEAARPAAEMALQLLALADEAQKNYQSAKADRVVLDFNDLLINTRELLLDPSHKYLRKRLAANLRLLLVDEFQDTDPLQVELVRALCDNEVTRGKLFFVGDYKQSIYRFRGAQPHVFRRLREDMPPNGRMPLSLNFRSQPAILDFVNALFSGYFGQNYEPLRAYRKQSSDRPAVEFLWAAKADFIDSKAVNDPDSAANTELSASTADDATEDNQPPAERRRRREADWIARRIRVMLDSGKKIVGDSHSGVSALRGARQGDIAMLFRALTDVEYYEEALRRYGIDYYLVGGRAFYAQQEIYDLLNLLRTLQSPADDASLLGVLRSPFFNLLDETIFWLARQPGGLSAALFAETLPSEIDEQQGLQTQFAVQTIARLRTIKDRVTIAELIEKAIDFTGYDALLLVEFLGARKLANLYKLIDQARTFDQSGLFTLSDFILQLSEFVARRPDEPLAATQSENMNVVRLMTIHQAKGLEFPIVIVPDLARRLQENNARAAFTPELGPMIQDKKASGGYDFFSATEGKETHAELIRLLYVAATRAADYLILSSGLEEQKDVNAPWMELLSESFDLWTGKSLISDLQVKVTDAQPQIQGTASLKRARPRINKILDKVKKQMQNGESHRPRHLAPIAPDRSTRRQFSFSRLSGALHERSAPNLITAQQADDFFEPALDPLGLGTLVHAVLAEVDFSKPDDLARIVHRLAPLHLPEADGQLAEPMEMIGRFISSDRAAQIAAAREVYRELEFLLAWPPGSRDPNARFLQGFIDCLYCDSGGAWHLIDYKTNRVTAETMAQTAAEYEMQMFAYALATERILKTAPVELTLCFLRPGLEHHFLWNEQAKKSLIEKINQLLP